MKIEKEYNVQELVNKLKEEIENCLNRETKRVRLDVLQAQNIVDVLEVVAGWEKKKESKLIDRKNPHKGYYPDCFGCRIDGDEKCNLCVSEKECKIITEEENEDIW